MRMILAAIFCFLSNSCFGWAESGHAIISILAAADLSPAARDKLVQLILKHPRFAQDFAAPSEIPAGKEKYKWTIGRIGYWPDVARSQEQYNRPTWHYQLGATMTMGDTSQFEIPDDPPPLPYNATADTQELYVAQAVGLNMKILANKANSEVQRAVAACWIVHLIGDMHLPCHAGSLYAQYVFTDLAGDAGANRIKIGRDRLHGIWDALLGDEYERGDINRRMYELQKDKTAQKYKGEALEVMDPQIWIAESRQIAKESLYTAEIQRAVQAAIDAKASRLPSIQLSNAYGRKAGEIARIRAVQAAARISNILEELL